MDRKIDFSKFIIFDGGMGTLLQAQGLVAGELPESYNLLYPEMIAKIHKAYSLSGADILTTNTFGANRYKMQQEDYQVQEIIEAAVQIAKNSCPDKLIALDIGPLGQLMAPLGNLSFEEAYQAFQEQVLIGQRAGADLIIIETMSDVYELKIAILAAKENSTLPIICTMTFEKDGRSLMGTDPLTMVNIIQDLGVSALGINCSLGPKEIFPLVQEILTYSKLPVIVQPNAGLPEEINGQTVFNVGPDEFAQELLLMAHEGVSILGGCCGTTPEHIKALKRILKDLQPIHKEVAGYTAVSSATQTVKIGAGVTIIGERINPTGKKKMQAALREQNMEYLLLEAVEQRKNGAHILDVNVGLPDIDECQLMLQSIQELQSIINLPLQIDSSDPRVLEEAARIYQGKPLLNSVNGKADNMEKIFPIVKKYGAAIIALTLDEEGIPRAEDRLAIAGKIIRTAAEYGISKENIIIDCLVLTASAQQEQVWETIKALNLVKEKLGVKTALGISNVSFGLPARGLLNRTFLSLALGAGLDAPIINPMDREIMGTIHAYNLLMNYDPNGEIFISQEHQPLKPPNNLQLTSSLNLKQMIIDGLKSEAQTKTKELLETKEPLDIVDHYLIPALNQVGDQYEKGEIFLPQLIQAAETVKEAFKVLKENLVHTGGLDNLKKEKIILATVRGDIHDIGKNIVRILLENYGYEVLDLGKDVPEKLIVETVQREKVRLVGLSALMTTTVKNMASAIKALRNANQPVKIMVGGAVLNPKYAQMVGADLYAQDAQEAVRLAQAYFQR